MSIEHVFLILLNLYGIRWYQNFDRVRLKIRFCGRQQLFFLAVCVNTRYTPFSIVGQNVCCNNDIIGSVFEIENDTCSTSYFRNENRSLTLNSNSRSSCRGCAFCGTFSLVPDDVYNLQTQEKMREHLVQCLETIGKKDFSDVDNVTIVTGCFPNEEATVSHLLMLDKELKRLNFTGEIGYLGTQIRSSKAMDTINREIRFFDYIFALECFERRGTLLAPLKNVSESEIKQIMTSAKQHGFRVRYTYILGLDSYKTVMEKNIEFFDYVNDCPIVQVFQNYVPNHEIFRPEEAKEIEYFFRARRFFSMLFGKRKVSVRTWENYRGLWYSD